MSGSTGGGQPTGGGDNTSWFGKRDAIYAGVLAVSLGGTQALQHKSDVNTDVLAEKVAVIDRSVNELRDPGGPVLREAVGRLKNHEDTLRSLSSDLRAGVSRETIDSLRGQLTEAKESDREMRAQIEALRNTIDGLRQDIAQMLGRRLVGPAR